ncbi:RNA-binding PUA-like domain of methyltransferase RsmF [uncultured archaeon]|nr:RNA-binding PUA-like domain of methyltransferase RsmF [uncultured archaeon]
MSPGSSRVRNVFEPVDRSEVAELWHSRFGIPNNEFDGFQFFRKAQSIWAISDSDLPQLSYEALGMRIMSLKDCHWKPTTSALQIYGRHASKSLVHLDEEQFRVFLAGGSQPIQSDSEPGYVVVFYRGDVLGCGLYSHGKLVSQLPKERRMVI